ncbi:hypothetical protein SKAU_G00021510 [Synaphobranchus kaupii]|uniref:Pancreatic progenitor cell differentiation and proliferation factor-like protein n=1 Tax=Synaphobranchus kaupii TaxID=118154 RepID=A0A9Q1JD63_SYNKA|nr:hypothetical protein SKAU_G00021510 [Synaphobranchus kaupii]
MAAVPSAGCLLAKKQFYRTRLNSVSSNSSTSSSTCCDLAGDPEKIPTPHGVHIPFEKCWWLKKFLTCDVVHHNITEPSVVNGASS